MRQVSASSTEPTPISTWSPYLPRDLLDDLERVGGGHRHLDHVDATVLDGLGDLHEADRSSSRG